MSSPGFNTHEAWQQLGVDPRDANAMLKVMLGLRKDLDALTAEVHVDMEKRIGQIEAISAAMETQSAQFRQLAERVRSISWKTT